MCWFVLPEFVIAGIVFVRVCDVLEVLFWFICLAILSTPHTVCLESFDSMFCTVFLLINNVSDSAKYISLCRF